MTILSAALLMLCIAGFGHLHLALYPVIATAGILAALSLSMATARRAGLSPDRLWDAGVFAVVAAFVVSRILGAILFLVIERGHITLSFLEILNFSSISYLSVLVTGVLVVFWLRRRQLPLLRVMDAWAPCAALLWAALSLADAASASQTGMPTRLPWGVRVASTSGTVRVHPVAMYDALAALAICVILLALMRSPRRPGRLSAMALVAAGAIAFLLDMLRVPEASSAHNWLDTSQWIALAGVIAGAALLALAPRPEAR